MTKKTYTKEEIMFYLEYIKKVYGLPFDGITTDKIDQYRIPVNMYNAIKNVCQEDTIFETNLYCISMGRWGLLPKHVDKILTLKKIKDFLK